MSNSKLIILHTVGNVSLECEIYESENPPNLVEEDTEGIFQNSKYLNPFKLRQNVYSMLKTAKSQLPKEVHIKALETYRPLEKQIMFWNSITQELKLKHPEYSEERLEKEANVFIANPYKQGSGHQTGGAVDLTLCDYSGKEFDMGTEYKEFNKLTRTSAAGLTPMQQNNRNILLRAMETAGFVNYPEEWWHYSYGELEWAVITRTKKTLYAPLKI